MSDVHQSVVNIHQTLLHSNLPQNLTQTRDAVYQALATANHAI
jgi:hypothetical protein